ncbi:hypothetical protein TNCV_2271351 [Trichonephila clavipes]|nr:hypothetical protein TNCV_2271351 [Trichonephila clavipes]
MHAKLSQRYPMRDAGIRHLFASRRDIVPSTREQSCDAPRATVNEKIAQFCVEVKKRTEVVALPIPPRIVVMVRRAPEEEKRKGGAGTPRDLCHIDEKLNNCGHLRLWSTCPSSD